MKFKFYEIRPCVEHEGETYSFLGEPVYHSGIGGNVHTPTGALDEAANFYARNGGEIFWTLYGRDEEGLACAIGDFNHFSQALDVLNAILAPMAEARDAVIDRAGCTEPDPQDLLEIANDLDDVINQSTNAERL